jgi:hypothetical protein
MIASSQTTEIVSDCVGDELTGSEKLICGGVVS